MKNRFITMMTAGVLAAMLTVTPVFAAPSIMLVTEKVETPITEEDGILDAEGNPVTDGAVIVSTTTDEKTQETILMELVSEKKKSVIEKLKEGIKKGKEDKDMSLFKEVLKEISDEKEYEYEDQEDTFDILEALPLTEPVNVYVVDAAGKVLEGARNIPVKDFELPTITEEITVDNMRNMHCNKLKDKWMISKIDKIDYKAKTISFIQDIAGPAMFIYNLNEGR